MSIVAYSLTGWPQYFMVEFQRNYGQSEHGLLIIRCGNYETRVELRVFYANANLGREQLRDFRSEHHLFVDFCSPDELKLILKIIHGFRITVSEREKLRMRQLLRRFGVHFFEVICTGLTCSISSV